MKAELFTGTLGYEHVSDLGANPTQHQLLWGLGEFCRSPDRRPDDILAVYITGHGEVLDNDEYVLLTSDTDLDDLYDALPPGTLARKILAGTKVRRRLILDTLRSPPMSPWPPCSVCSSAHGRPTGRRPSARTNSRCC
jgi:hypothetical protein